MVKALSVRQPWAWLIIYGGKDIENRDWPTSHRGPTLIHAGKQWDIPPEDWADAFPDVALPPPDEILRGGIVGRVNIIGCARAHSSKWFEGDWGFVLRNPEPLPFHPCSGKLGFFDVDYQPPTGPARSRG